MAEIEIPRVKLGTQGLEVSKIVYGCLGLSGFINDPLSDEAATAVVKHAFDRGITTFDTSDAYGADHANEIIVAKAIKHLPRDKIQVCSKFGIVSLGADKVIVNGTPEYVRSACEASLKRLGVDYLDLYHQHRVDTTVPIEDTIGELKKLVEEGKIKYIGLSEASADTIRRANAVHPISTVQMEYSLWTREQEEEIIPLCRQLKIGIIAYSPLGHGFFGGKGITEAIPANSFLGTHPRFQEEAMERNRKIYARIEELAKKHNCTPAQLALAWVSNQGDDVVPLPGTTKIKNLDANIESLRVKLTKEDLKEIADAVPNDEVAGATNDTSLYQVSWRFADTPPKKH